MANLPMQLYRAIGFTVCFGVMNPLHAQCDVTIQNQSDAPWTILKNMDSNQIDLFKVDGQESKMNIIHFDLAAGLEMICKHWEIKSKQTGILKMASRYRRPSYGRFYLGDSNGNYRVFDLKDEVKGAAKITSFKEIGYKPNPKMPMVECKSSGENKDDGVTELAIVDSKPIILIKAAHYPVAGHGKH
jgi:hypothetical protein